ncbi:hypothetical protein [Hyphomicrobium sp.]|uniref:porin n=1 Tax=Hyphomicrobium sp. TaxID=82 RepID=UPI001D525820|nr:hypothetical protein [Hyphomicrobium sp.]MBY0561410.1 hypothetical protein [Hyphomicrobium sp.]
MEGTLGSPTGRHGSLRSFNEGTGGFRRAVIIAGLAAAAFIFDGGSVIGPSKALAADKGVGSDCCADLEERVAELEATAARKGNRKISLTVFGVVDEAIMHISGDGFSGNWAVGQNSNAETLIGVKGEAVVMPHLKAGYVLEIAMGDELNSPFAYGTGNGVYTRRSYGYVDSDQFGKVTVGLAGQATDGVAELSVANTQVAARMLSLRPLVGGDFADALDIFDGGRANLVRYDSPTMFGAVLSASYAAGGLEYRSTGDIWDVALRWKGEFNGFQALAGIGYRNGIALTPFGNLGSVSFSGTQYVDPKILSGSASIKHVASGLFVNGAAGKLDLGGVTGDAIGDITAWTVQAGAEEQWLPVGATTVFAEYADSDFGNIDLGLKYWGFAAVQHLDGAAADLYVDYRRYDIAGSNADFFMGGLKIQF